MAQADLVILNASVWTGDPDRPEAQAVAVRAGRILAVGRDDEIRALVGPATHLIDAGGRRLVPGFNDAHVHLVPAGLDLSAPDFRRAKDERHFVSMLAEHVASRETHAWITRGRWDHESWPGRRPPTRELIDPVSPDNPVFLSRIDGHVAVANSLALRRAGITRETPDPPGGRIQRDARTGEPTGLLLDAAMGLVRRLVPPESERQRLAAVRAALRHAARLGVTSVHVPCTAADLALFRRLRDEGALTVRIHAMVHYEDLAAAVEQAARGDEWLRAGAVKLFADGSFGARSALLSEPYQDQPSSVGLAMHSPEELKERVREVHLAGLQVALHAIGDEAVRRALDAFEQIAPARGPGRPRHRIEHAQMVRPEDRRRFAALGVVASIQPSHCIDDMRWLEARLGSRCPLAHPYRSLAEAGVRVALGTDWNVAPLDPMVGLYAAVTRESVHGGPPGGWQPQERVSIDQALRDYTAGSAWAEFQEQCKGTLRPGSLADMVLLSQDILTVPPPEILQTRAELTVVAGRIVFRADS